jgi:hypothetical protein
MRTTAIALGLMLVACGGGSDSSESTTGMQDSTESVGSEFPPGPESVPGGSEGSSGQARGSTEGRSGAGSGAATNGNASQGEPEEADSDAPARLRAELVIGSDKVDGKVRVLNSRSDKVVEEGRSGQAFTLEPGNYVLKGEITDESILADTPTRKGEPFRLEAGANRTEKVEFGRARIRLKVVRGRQRIRKATVKLRPQGADEVVLEYQPGEEYIPVSPGRYDATIEYRNTRVEVTGIMFPAGGKRSIPVRVN